MKIQSTSCSCAILLVCCAILSFNSTQIEAQEDANAATASAAAPVMNGAYNPATSPSSATDARSDSAKTHPGSGTSAHETLETHGVVFGFSYKSEIFGSLLRNRVAKHDVFFLGSGLSFVDLDLTKMNVYRGRIFMSAQTVHGTGLNENPLGAIQLPSNLDAEEYTKLIEAWYGDTYLKDRLNFKVGRLYADSDFGVIENGGDFLNASYGVVPNAPMPTYPNPELGISVWGSPAEWVSIRAGMYHGSRLDGIDEDDPALRKGVFTLAEAKFKPHAKGSSQDGAYRIGVWQQAHGTWREDKTDETTPVRNYGVYAVADYWFRKNSEEDRGPGVFARWGWAPSDRNEISNYWGMGITYPGLNPLRRQDTMGLGVTQILLPGSKRETVCELFYKLEISKRVMLQPDLQWVRNPSGTGANRAIAGMRLGLNF